MNTGLHLLFSMFWGAIGAVCFACFGSAFSWPSRLVPLIFPVLVVAAAIAWFIIGAVT